MKPKLLWVGDAGCPSGFALATHNILDTLRKHYDVTVLGINYRGDPHEYPYPIYAAAPGGDPMGVGRLIWMCDLVEPDIIVLQNDPWNIPAYTRVLKRFEDYAHIPIVAAVAVDGKNCMGRALNQLSHAIFWTEFGQTEAKVGGYTGPSSVVPLGVNLDTYKPIDKLEARNRRLPKKFDDAFIVGNVNRNQPRKRLDLTIRYFALWHHKHKPQDAYLYLHVAPTGDEGIQCAKLAEYYNIVDYLALMEPATHYGISDAEMCDTYNMFDVQISTTQGEGFGLTTLEGMACGVPQILPDWSALGELFKDAAWMVPCTSTAIGPPFVNVLGGVADETKFLSALYAMHAIPEYREQNRKAAIERANQSRFRWNHIGEEWINVLAGVLAARPEPVGANA